MVPPDVPQRRSAVEHARAFFYRQPTKTYRVAVPVAVSRVDRREGTIRARFRHVATQRVVRADPSDPAKMSAHAPTYAAWEDDFTGYVIVAANTSVIYTRPTLDGRIMRRRVYPRNSRNVFYLVWCKFFICRYV